MVFVSGAHGDLHKCEISGNFVEASRGVAKGGGVSVSQSEVGMPSNLKLGKTATDSILV